MTKGTRLARIRRQKRNTFLSSPPILTTASPQSTWACSPPIRRQGYVDFLIGLLEFTYEVV